MSQIQSQRIHEYDRCNLWLTSPRRVDLAVRRWRDVVLGMDSRRTFLGRCIAVSLALIAGARPAWARTRPSPVQPPHPTPRPGITAAKMPTPQQLAEAPGAQAVFDSVREIPEIVDGIRCHCGCADNPDFYSLLSCYEGVDPMAKSCPICQGQGRLAARLHKDGKTLDEIRVAIDARYG
jgi:hypothetical protein